MTLGDLAGLTWFDGCIIIIIIIIVPEVLEGVLHGSLGVLCFNPQLPLCNDHQQAVGQEKVVE